MFKTTIDHHLRAVAAAGVLTLCFVLAGCSDRTNREDFAQLIKGKTEQEVLKNAGKPASVDEPSKELHVWTYKSRTFDVAHANKFDEKTIVTFTPSPEGKMVVADVKFE